MSHSYPDPEVLYEAGPCLVVNKPGGLLTQAPPGIDSMEIRVRQFLMRRENRQGNIYLATCHRLDRPAAGALIFARNVRAARRIAEQFENRSVGKTYWAIVEGCVTPRSGQWSDFMRKIPGQPRSEIVAADHPDAQFAKLQFQVLDSRNGLSLLQIELETGRTHQIRLQSATRGFPVAGDACYGSARPFGPQTDDTRGRWIALMARRVRFVHPLTRENVDVTAPMLAPWRDAVDAAQLDLSE